MRWGNSLRRFALVAFLVAFTAPLLVHAQETGGTAPAAGKVDMKDLKFNPQLLMVVSNTTVTWTNRDSFSHDVTAADRSYESDGGPGGMGGGAVYSRKFDKPGVYDYYCTVHSTGAGKDMWGRVVVVNPPLLQAAAGEGGTSPEAFGVRWLAHWVGIISFIAVLLTLVLYYFVLRYGETVHATDHRDRKEK